MYQFAFELFPKKKTELEESLNQIAVYLENQMSLEGSDHIQLPTQVGEIKARWSEKKEYITPQILLLEIVMVVLLGVLTKRKETQDRQRRIQRLRMEIRIPEAVRKIHYPR